MEAWCNYCEKEQPVVETVSWQPDLCAECGNPIQAG